MSNIAIKIPTFQTDYSTADKKMKLNLVHAKTSAKEIVDSLLKDSVRGGKNADDDAPAAKRSKSSSSCSSSSSLPPTYDDDEDAKKVITEGLKELPGILQAGFEQLHTFKITKDIIQQIVADNVDAEDLTKVFQVRCGKSELNDVKSRVKADPAFKKEAGDVGAIIAKLEGRKANNDDDDIEVESGNADIRASVMCPITKTLMEQPVRGDKCPHVFCRKGLLNLLMLKHKAKSEKDLTDKIATDSRFGTDKCPIPGCKAMITWGSVTEDMDTLVLVEQYKDAKGAKGKGAGAGKKKKRDNVGVLLEDEE